MASGGFLIRNGRIRSAQVRPINVGAKFFAANLAVRFALDSRAVFGGELALPVSPKADGLRGNTKLLRRFGRAAQHFDCHIYRVHAGNSTTVDVEFQQMYLFNFLRMFNF